MQIIEQKNTIGWGHVKCYLTLCCDNCVVCSMTCQFICIATVIYIAFRKPLDFFHILLHYSLAFQLKVNCVCLSQSVVL